MRRHSRRQTRAESEKHKKRQEELPKEIQNLKNMRTTTKYKEV